MGMRRSDLTGQRFGKLLVLERAPNDKYNCTCWKVRCDCGTTKIVLANSLRNGNTRSCSCLRKEMAVVTGGRNLKHGYARAGRVSPLFTAWHKMKSRCLNPNAEKYPSYGGRGIKVCDRWLGPEGFTNFIADMGEKPTPKHSIDRIDNNGNYELRNAKGELQCRWATAKEQNDNRRCSAKNKIKTVEQIAA